MVVKDTITQVDTIEKVIRVTNDTPKEEPSSEPVEEPKEVVGTELSL